MKTIGNPNKKIVDDVIGELVKPHLCIIFETVFFLQGWAEYSNLNRCSSAQEFC